jgi:glycosyltransferase involved in cell wall biosynthesis
VTERTLGVHNPDSLGIGRYVRRLAAAIGELGEEYVPAAAPDRRSRVHLHLGNSSRRVAAQSLSLRRPYLLTVHDVVPRTPVLMPLYRAGIYPLCVRRARRIVVHSAFAAELLRTTAGVDAGRISVIAHPATEPRPGLDVGAARAALGIADGPPLFVVTGVLKGAKVTDAVVAAAAPLIRQGHARLLLAGRVVDRVAVAAALGLGAQVLENPDDLTYDRAVMAADCAVCLRADTVGESNGPVLDAIGAHKPLLCSRIGSMPEVAGAAALYVEDLGVDAIRAGLERLLDEDVREELRAAAARRARECSWARSAQEHLDLLGGLDQ